MFTNANEIRVETSTCCNYDCIMCARAMLRRKKEVMSTELFRLIIRKTLAELPSVDTITLSGFGEFTTDPHWRNKVIDARQNFKTVHIVTNASLLTEGDAAFLLEHAADIRVSMYGIDDETFREIHHPPPETTYVRLKSVIEYMAANRKKHQRIILNFLQVDANKACTGQWIAGWKGKVDLIEAWLPHNWIDAHHYRTLDTERLPTCGRPKSGPVQVQVDGTVNVCCFDYNGELLIGDLSRQNFADIFNGKAMERYQKMHREKQADLIPLCKKCDQRNSVESKARAVIFNSGFDPLVRVNATSTQYDPLLSNTRDA